MSRYIDADALKLAVIKATTYGDALRAVKDAPSIDICFCRECKHQSYCCRPCCKDDYSFCSDGEREGE